METENRLFKEKISSEEKDPIATKKKEVAELRSKYKEAGAAYEMGLNLGKQYWELATLVANDSSLGSEKNEIESSVYIAEAIKFGAYEALHKLLQVKDSTLFLTTFLLAIDKTRALTRTCFDTIWFIYFNVNSVSGDLPAVNLKNQLLLHFTNFYRRTNIHYNLSPMGLIEPEEIGKLTAEFLTQMLNSFDPDIEKIYQLIKFSKEEPFLSETYLKIYIPHLFYFAKQNPEKFVALELSKEIIFFISEIHFANNDVLRDIECLCWLKDHQLKNTEGENTIPNETFDKIFYDRVLKCCEGELFIGELLQYFKEISKNFSIQPTEGLLSAIKSLYYSGSFENIRTALTLTARICKGIPKDSNNSLDSPETSLSHRFIRFYKVCFQPDSMLTIMLPFGLQQIKDHIDQKKSSFSSVAFFSSRFSSLILKFEELSKPLNSIADQDLIAWWGEIKEKKITATRKKFDEILTLLENFQLFISNNKNLHELEILIITLRSDITQLWHISPALMDPPEIELKEIKDSSKEESATHSDDIINPLSKTSKEEQDKENAGPFSPIRHF